MAITNYRRFYAILGRMPPLYDREEQKKQLVLQYTNNRTCSLREMTEKEYKKMCHELGRRYGTDEAYRKLKNTCLRLMQQLGKNTADWDEVDRYCLDPRIAGKRFREFSYNELGALERKLRAIKHKEDKKTSINQ